MVLNTCFKLIKFNLQITFPTFPIKIYLLLTPYVLLFPCACVYCQCQKWPSVFIAWRNAYNYHIFCANHCRECWLCSMCGGDMIVAGSATLHTRLVAWFIQYKTWSSGVQSLQSVHFHTTLHYYVVRGWRQPRSERDWSQEQCRLVIRSLLVIRYVMDGRASVLGE